MEYLPQSYVEPDMFEAPRHNEWPFAGLEPLAYALIMADPPWHFETRSKMGEAKSPQAQYDTMSIAQIKNLPVADLAQPDCMLWMWGTNPMLPLQMEVISHWGFKFVTSGVWIKTTKHGKLSFGTGYIHRSSHEPWLIGVRGRPDYKSKSVRSALLARVREHSRKPDEAYAMARALIPHGRAADLFSRERRPGWESWGNELGKFNT